MGELQLSILDFQDQINRIISKVQSDCTLLLQEIRNESAYAADFKAQREVKELEKEYERLFLGREHMKTEAYISAVKDVCVRAWSISINGRGISLKKWRKHSKPKSELQKPRIARNVLLKLPDDFAISDEFLVVYVECRDQGTEQHRYFIKTYHSEEGRWYDAFHYKTRKGEWRTEAKRFYGASHSIQIRTNQWWSRDGYRLALNNHMIDPQHSCVDVKVKWLKDVEGLS